MSLVGIGIDVVSVARMEELLTRHPARFLARCFRGPASVPGAVSPRELAGLWAAKEAFLKALGSDVGGIPYRDVDIVSRGEEPPSVSLHGRAARALAATGAGSIHLSLGGDREFAVASVILEK